MAIEKFYKESILVGPQENEAWKYESGGNLLVFVKDTLRAQVEATSGGRLTVLYDDQGSPSIMYVLPRFKLEDIDSNLGSGWHPAFLVNGVEKTEIFIGAFEACVINNRACSLPGQDPKVYVMRQHMKLQKLLIYMIVLKEELLLVLALNLGFITMIMWE